jgi:alkylhydroperoxidase/carboxymuconolactone decarboxylase family protein YurZ
MHEPKHDWRAVIKHIDPVAEEKIGAYVAHTIARDSKIPRKYKELILRACAAALRHGSSTRTHGMEAMYYSATDEEIIEVLSLVSMSSGFTAFIDGIEALGDQLTLNKK